MSTYATQLSAALRKIKAASYARDRNVAIAEAEAIIDRMAAACAAKKNDTIGTRLRFNVIKLLAAMGEGDLYPGMRNYVKHDKVDEFNTAADALRDIIGPIEEIELRR